MTITKILCAAHAIRLPDGSMEPLHGHNWEIDVTVGSLALNTIDVVMDFHELERIVETIISQADNRNLNDLEPFALGSISPTAERVAWWIGSKIATQLPDGIKLVRISVTEAPGCRATYMP